MHASHLPPTNAIEAVTHVDLFDWYAAQRELRPFVFDAALGVWIASSAEAVDAVLTHPALGVRPPNEPVPPTILGTPLGDLFARLARMTDGETQRVTKAAIVAALQQLDLEELAARSRHWAAVLPPEQLAFGLSAYVLGSLCGVPDAALPECAHAVRAVVVGIAPGSSVEQIAAGQAAVETLARLLTPCIATPGSPLHILAQQVQVRARGIDDPITTLANSIALLQQASDATAGLIGLAVERHFESMLVGGDDVPDVADLLADVLLTNPPVHNTRRWAHADVTLLGHLVRCGEGVLVLLAAASRDSQQAHALPLAFGRGAHACPASTHAVVIAQAAVEQLLRPEVAAQVQIEPDPTRRYLPLPNARIPRIQRRATPEREADGC